MKSIIYKALNFNPKGNWVKALENAVEALNRRKLPSLKGHEPREFSSNLDDTLIPYVSKEPDWRERLQNQKAYEKKKSLLQQGEFVFANLKLQKNEFLRSFQIQGWKNTYRFT